MNRVKRVLVCCLLVVLCLGMVSFVPAYAETELFTIKDKSGNCYVPVATDINVKDTLGVDKVYCLWVPEETGALTIETSNFSRAQCFCATSPLTCTEESGKMIVSVGSGHDPNSCLAGVADTYPGADAYIDEASAVEKICVELVGETTVDILIQRGGKNPQDDVTPPVITLADNGVERTSDATATIRFTSSEAGTVYYSLVSADAVDTSATGTTMVSGDNTLDIVGLTTGEAKVYIKAKDASGNVTESVLEVTVPAYVPTYEVLLTSITPAMYNQGYRYVSATAAGLPLKSNDDPYMCIYKGAQAGQTVKVTLLIPEADKELESISLTTNDGNNTPIDVTVDGTENSFSFTMPAANVRVDSFTIKDSVVVRYNLKADVSLLYENLEDLAGNRQGTVTFTDADRVTLVQAKPRQQVTVTADPKPYTAGDMFKREFVRWKVIDGIEVSPEDQMKPSFTFEMPENDVYLFAEFKNVGTEITWGTKIDNVIGNVTRVSLSGVASERSPFTFAEGAELGAVPLGEDWWYRYEFTGWTVTRDEEVLTDVDTSQLVSDDRPEGTFGYATWAHFSVSGKKMTVMANFHERTFAGVTVEASPATMGSAAVSVGGDPTTNIPVVYEGQTVTLTATPGERYMLKGWEVKDADNKDVTYKVAEDVVNVATFTMPATGKDITAKAIFEVDPNNASTACVLEDVELAIPSATVSREGSKITITLPAGTDTSKLADAMLKFTVSKYADIIRAGDDAAWPAAGKACGMELDKAVTFTVRSEKNLIGKDETAKADYKVTITVAKSSAKDITAIKLLNADKSVIAEGKLNGTTWTITLPPDTDKALINKIGTSTDVFMQINYTGVSLAQAEGYDDATGTIGKWSSGNVMCGVSPNSSKTFTVTAEDGSAKTYTVEIKYTAPNAPTLSGGSATRTSKTGATVKFTSSEAGNYFYKVVDHGATVPTVDTSKSGTSAVKGENTITLSNLTEDARDIYIVVKNASGGESSALKVEIPASWADAPDTPMAEPKNASAFVRDIVLPMDRQQGDKLPVSVFQKHGVLDGTWENGTSVFSKRGVATKVPKWDGSKCIQCNRCSMCCPHAAIRPVLLTEEEKAGAPESFVTVPAKGLGKDAPSYFFRMQVSPYDCLGCGVCLTACPAKGALEMVPFETQREQQPNFDNYAMNEKLLKKDIISDKSVKTAQFAKPYFQFSAACAGCAETTYIKLVTQLFGSRMYVANASGCSSAYGGAMPMTPYSCDSRGFGPCWEQSLFEDNAEFAYGFLRAHGSIHGEVELRLKALKEKGVAVSEIGEYLAKWQDPAVTREVSDALIAALEKCEQTEDVPYILENREYLSKKSIWAIGGDGWAYDIGFGGIDHVLAQNRDINMLVMDTEVYSNTGGQSSKSTPTSATAKFAASGKKVAKKDLGAMMMQYGYVYVAQVAMGADQAQTLKALREAESYDGPSIVICYCPCLEQHIKAGMSCTQDEMKKAVECGYWHLYRYDPRRIAEGKNPFQLDSPAPDTDKLMDFLMGENRFASLKNNFPERADALYQKEIADVKARYQKYRKMAED